MSNESHRIRDGVLRLGITNFWSGDLGLTLISISLVFLVFVVVPTREAGIPGRIFFDSAIFVLMALAALAAKQSRLETSFTGGIMGNLMSEFWPDLQNLQKKFLHHKQTVKD